MSFNDWYNEADMPSKVDGVWVDLETGLPYAEPDATAKPYQSFSASADVKGYRAFAKQFGGKALTGTAKQKDWAEKLRYEILQKVSASEASTIIAIDAAATAKFWIEARFVEPKKIADQAASVLALEAMTKTVSKMYQDTYTLRDGAMRSNIGNLKDKLRRENGYAEVGNRKFQPFSAKEYQGELDKLVAEWRTAMTEHASKQAALPVRAPLPTFAELQAMRPPSKPVLTPRQIALNKMQSATDPVAKLEAAFELFKLINAQKSAEKYHESIRKQAVAMPVHIEWLQKNGSPDALKVADLMQDLLQDMSKVTDDTDDDVVRDLLRRQTALRMKQGWVEQSRQVMFDSLDSGAGFDSMTGHVAALEGLLARYRAVQNPTDSGDTKTITVAVPVSTGVLIQAASDAWGNLSSLSEKDLIRCWKYVLAANYMLKNSIRPTNEKWSNRHILGQAGKPELVDLLEKEMRNRALDKKYTLFIDRKPTTAFDSLDSGKTDDLGEVHSVPVDLINTDPEAYQWREDVDEDGHDGRDIEDFDQDEQAPILLHEREDGSLYVVDGHHRLAMAIASDLTDIDAHIVREDDGYSVEDAKLLGQMLNRADLVAKAQGLMGGVLFDSVDGDTPESSAEAERLVFLADELLDLVSSASTETGQKLTIYQLTPEQSELVARSTGFKGANSFVNVTSSTVQHIKKNHPEIGDNEWRALIQMVRHFDGAFLCRKNPKGGRRIAFVRFLENGQAKLWAVNAFVGGKKNPSQMNIVTHYQNDVVKVLRKALDTAEDRRAVLTLGAMVGLNLLKD